MHDSPPPSPNVVVTVRDLATGTTETHRTHNTICEGYHKLLVRLADPEDRLTHDDIDYHLLLGEDDSTTPSYTDTSLNAEVASVDVSDFINEGTDLYTSTFLDSTEANPSSGTYQSIVEVGIKVTIGFETTEYLCNHSTIGEVQKNSQKTATIESTLKLNNDTNDA